MMDFYSISALINAISSLSLGVIILSKRSNNSSFSFSLFCFSISFWSIGYFFWQISSSKEGSLFWLKFLTLGSIFVPIFFFYFSIVFLKLYKKILPRAIFYLGLLFGFFVLVLTPTNLFVKSVEKKLAFDFWPNAGDLYWLLLFIFCSYLIMSIFLFLRGYRNSFGINKEQIKFILIGTGLGFLGGLTNFPLWYDIPIYPIGNILVSFYVIFIAYAIIRYRFMDIKLVLRQSSVYIISLGVIFALASVAKIFVTKYLGEFSFWMDLMVIFFAVLVFPYIKDYFFRLANKYFFTSLYDSGKLILKTGNDLKTFLNIEKVYEYLYSTFWKNLHTKAFGVLSYDEENGNYKLQYNQGFKAKKGDAFARNPFVEAKFIVNNEIVITEELKNVYGSPKTKDLIELLEGLGVELLIPLKVKGNLVGLLALGSKETEEAYNDEDLQVLEIISSQAAVAIENAQLYSEAKGFNLHLKREVKKATEDVKKANRDLSKTNQKLKDAYNRLKQLDSAKNEFISIASHQLRTPLTSIKGFISMIREGDYGKIGKETDEALRKIFISNERLIKLVNDLLSLSRIESGRFTFIFRENDISFLVKSILDNFKIEAQEKNIKLKYNKPKKPIKPFIFDKDKMHEVVSNLIDNAIKYTSEGKVEVSLEDTKDKVVVAIKDTGKGMEKDEAKYIFEKFRRGIGSSNLNTEGTGLGLYVCLKIIDAHKGKIYADSDGPNKGSQFTIELRKDLKAEEGK